MRGIFVLLIIVGCVNANLLTCVTDIGKTVPTLARVITALVAGVFDIPGMISLINHIKGLANTCDLRICLEHATQRCEADNSQGCEQYGLIIYPKCRAGFKSFGCCLCHSICPSGFRDDGAFCAKPAAYGRGAGYPWKFGDKAFNYDGARRRCEKNHGQGRCEMNGLIYYPKCAENFHNVGCCVCSPNCPSGFNDIGVSCEKQTYGRGVGYPFKFGDCKDIPKKYPLDMTQAKQVQMKQLETILTDVDALIKKEDHDRANILYQRAEVMMNEIIAGQ